MTAPLDQPFVCRKGHVTEAGWISENRHRCRECLLANKRRATKKWQAANPRYMANKARTWGREVINAKVRRYYWRYHEKELERRRLYYRRRVASRLEMT